MNFNEALFHPKFRKDLKSLPKEFIPKVEETIDSICKSPFSCDKLKGELSDIYRAKIFFKNNEYRLAFTIQNNSIVFIMIAKRESFYETLKRRFAK
jgi:mRNA-degrading endonuclease RelE of RelBE toxin-antitoxin system